MENYLGVCEWVFSVNGPLVIQIASEIGFTGIQLGDLGGETRQFPLNHRRVQEGYLEAVAHFGVKLQSLHLYTLVRQGTMLYAPDSAQGEQALKSIINGIRACSALGIDTLMLSSFFASEIKHDEQFHNYARVLRLACKMGAEKGVRIVFESVLPVAKILQMRELVGEDLKICYDTGNPVRWNSGNPCDEIRQIGVHAIDHIHLKDFPADKIGYCLLGEGCSHCADTVRFLKQMGYHGWWISENNYEAEPLGTNGDFVQLAMRDCETMSRWILSEADE